MKRREFLKGTAKAGIGASAAALVGYAGLDSLKASGQSAAGAAKLSPSATGKILVAFPISESVQVIDMAGPWEVFQDVMIQEGPHDEGMDHRMPFELYTVAESKEVVTATGAMKIVPSFTFADAPKPKIVVVAAQHGSDALHGWLKKVAASSETDLVASVCTGAFQLAAAGLLNGKSATTHHQALKSLQTKYPDVQVKSGLRFVDGGKIATAGGLTSGIDLALHVVERYYGRAVAQQTAEFMEYQSKGWMT
jgi:transcriptional regulator GlxA family with amidase domain